MPGHVQPGRACRTPSGRPRPGPQPLPDCRGDASRGRTPNSLTGGDGEGWSTHGSISSPRHFTYWRAAALEEVVAGEGWSYVSVRTGIEGDRGETWLELSAARDEVFP